MATINVSIVLRLKTNRTVLAFKHAMLISVVSLLCTGWRLRIAQVASNVQACGQEKGEAKAQGEASESSGAQWWCKARGGAPASTVRCVTDEYEVTGLFPLVDAEHSFRHFVCSNNFGY